MVEIVLGRSIGAALDQKQEHRHVSILSAKVESGNTLAGAERREDLEYLECKNRAFLNSTLRIAAGDG